MRFSRLVAALLPLSLAACLPTTDPPTVRQEVPIEQTSFASSLGVDLATSTKTASGMYYRDAPLGTGAAAVAVGDSVEVYYKGQLADGSQFDARQTGTPFKFKVGAGNVIKGWDEGLVGMKVGGTRQLIIPPALGYGASDYGPIPGNSVLVFSVTLVSDKK
ncbi:MAG: FKBP-type peptidyl-prolyl cis-trans isomerase [Gemmatirosa sp.]|nr:FKBP-type peptidyl-prolyl cis-trans isomerase [Gemmatirosa sp.]